MQALVVFESFFGNTRAVAEAVAEGLANVGSEGRVVFVSVRPVGDAPHAIPDDLDLLVVGAPTHQFGMSRPSSRAEARKRAGSAEASGTGVREWLDSLPAVSRRVAAATFTTHVDRPRWIRRMGSAARTAEARLIGLGFRKAAAPESFFVAGMAGPLLPGEAGRARAWGAALARAVAAEVERP